MPLVTNAIKHPLFIVLISFLLGGVALTIIQTKINDKKILKEKQITIMEDVANFSVNSATTFRAINIVATATNNKNFPVSQYLLLQDKLQENIEKTYSLSDKTERELNIYFPENYEDFHNARLNFQDKINDALEKIKSKGVQGKIFKDSDFDEQKIPINNILLKLKEKIRM